MAKGKSLESSQRGIAFSTVSAFEVSALILIVGAGTFDQSSSGGVFSIQVLSGLIQKYIGEVGVFVFAIGFVAAALSSMLAVPLGAGITVKTVFTRCEEENEEEEEEAAVGTDQAAADNLNQQQRQPLIQLKLVDETSNKTDGLAEFEQQDDEKVAAETPLQETTAAAAGAETSTSAHTPPPAAASEAGKKSKGERYIEYAYWAIISTMVLVATVVISLDGRKQRHQSLGLFTKFCPLASM